MASSENKQAILNSFEAELDVWLENQGSYTNGYDYETAYARFIHKISHKILQQSLGPVPKSRNLKKNFSPVSARLK